MSEPVGGKPEGNGNNWARWADLHTSSLFRRLQLRVAPQYRRFLTLRNPVLRDISREIPGTFLHSFLVGNAAGFAAFEIGANADIARAGGYYHDESKREHPIFFPEAFSGQRRPKEVSDEAELQYILSHPRLSAENLRQEGFPEEICRIVLEHHGTRKTRIKISKTLLQKSQEGDLHYKGPKPSTKEAVILMIADSAEAYLYGLTRDHTKPKLTEPEEFKAAVRRVGKDLREGQVKGDRRVDEPQFDDRILTAEEQAKVEDMIAEVLGELYDSPGILKKLNGYSRFE